MNDVTSYGYTALHFAIKYNNITSNEPTIYFLLDAVNWCDDMLTFALPRVSLDMYRHMKRMAIA
jgi:hypothetical protein